MDLLQSDVAIFGLAALGLVITTAAILRDQARADGRVRVRRSLRE